MKKANKDFSINVNAVQLKAGGFKASYSIINVTAGTEESFVLSAIYETEKKQ